MSVLCLYHKSITLSDVVLCRYYVCSMAVLCMSMYIYHRVMQLLEVRGSAYSITVLLGTKIMNTHTYTSNMSSRDDTFYRSHRIQIKCIHL